MLKKKINNTSDSVSYTLHLHSVPVSQISIDLFTPGYGGGSQGGGGGYGGGGGGGFGGGQGGGGGLGGGHGGGEYRGFYSRYMYSLVMIYLGTYNINCSVR